jgi:hypothetical protein
VALGFTYHSNKPNPTVAEVDAKGQAARLGLQRGDVVMSVNGIETPDLASLKAAAQQVGEGPLDVMVVYRAPNRVTLQSGAQPVFEMVRSGPSHAMPGGAAPDFEELMLREMQEQTKVLKETRGAVRAGFWFLAVIFVVVPFFNSCALQAQQSGS